MIFKNPLPFLFFSLVILATLAGCSEDEAKPASPTLASLTPATGRAGAPVTITGTAFGTKPEDIVVTFGTQPVVVTTSSPTEITTTVPEGLTGVVAVSVSVQGRPSNALDFTIIGPPAITALSATSGWSGSELTIIGTNFGTTAETTVKFGTVSAMIAQASTTELVTTVPALADGNYSITVTIGDKTATIAQQFTVVPVPPSLYWIGIDDGVQKIMKATVSGSSLSIAPVYTVTQDLVLTALVRDRNSQHLYWIEQGFDFDTFESTSTLWKGDTLGTEPVALTVPADGLKQVDCLTIDYHRNKLLWIDLNTVWRANLDGTEREQLFSTYAFEQLSGVTVNALNIYITESFAKVYQAPADGSQPPTAFIDKSDFPAEAGTNNVLVGATATDEALFLAVRPETFSDKSEVLKATLASTPVVTLLYQSTTGGTNALDVIAGVTQEPETGYLYWINQGSTGTSVGSIYRANSEPLTTPEKLLENLSLPAYSRNPINARQRQSKPMSVAASF